MMTVSKQSRAPLCGVQNARGAPWLRNGTCGAEEW